jgi:hypothetical protein
MLGFQTGMSPSARFVPASAGALEWFGSRKSALPRHAFEAFSLLHLLPLKWRMAYMASIAKDEFAEVVENATSTLAGELAAKSAEAHGAQTKSQQQTKQSRQDSPLDISREGSAKPARRKRNTNAIKRTQQAALTDKSEVKIPALSEEMITPVPQATNNASAPAIDTAKADFVADPEPVPEGGGFLCTFTLSRPGLVGLNKLAVHLNDLQDSGSIGGWQAKGWENPATKVRTLIGFANRADAIIAINSPLSRRASDAG